MNAPYKFTGKEQDPETDLTYFGARYYDAALGIWLGVDPLAEKYAGISPFVYAANNPIKYIDPDGKDHILYLVFQSGAAGVVDLANSIAKHTQSILNLNEINMQVQILYVGNEGFANGYKNKLDQTDGLAFIGNQSFVEKMGGWNDLSEGSIADDRVGYVNQTATAIRASRQDVNKDKSDARTSIHEALGHWLLGEKHSNAESSNPLAGNASRYHGTNIENFNNMMTTGDEVNLHDPSSFIFLNQDKKILAGKGMMLNYTNNVNGIKISICSNGSPIDNFTTRLNE